MKTVAVFVSGTDQRVNIPRGKGAERWERLKDAEKSLQEHLSSQEVNTQPMALKERQDESSQEWSRLFTCIEQVKSELEKVPYAREGEVPQTPAVRGEKL